jgi:hypothetical protein
LEAEIEKLKGRLAKAAAAFRAAEAANADLTARLDAALSANNAYVKHPEAKAPKSAAKPAPPQANCQTTINAYFEWFERLTGTKPAPVGKDWAALKEIHATFRQRCGPDATEEDIGTAFSDVLKVWPRLTGWQQGRKAAHEIRADLTNLIATHAQPLTVPQPNASTSGTIHPAPQRQPTSGPQSRYNAPSVNGNYGKL